MFEVESSKKKFNANTVAFNGEYPYVARGASNNGVRGYITEDKNYLNDGSTISFGQDTATMFYQEEPYFTGDKIKIVKPKIFNLNEKRALFFISAMKKSFANYSWGSSSFSESNINNTEIKLPTYNNKIDYDFMENVISGVQKLVIKSVVQYKDRIIAETKKVVSE